MSTVIRAITLKEVGLKDAGMIFRRECITGGIIGLMLGLMQFPFAAMGLSVKVGLTVALSLPTVSVLANLFGGGLPLLCDKAGLDPAVIAAPLMTTMVDCAGILAYLMIAQAVFGDEIENSDEEDSVCSQLCNCRLEGGTTTTHPLFKHELQCQSPAEYERAKANNQTGVEPVGMSSVDKEIFGTMIALLALALIGIVAMLVHKRRAAAKPMMVSPVLPGGDAAPASAAPASPAMAKVVDQATAAVATAAALTGDGAEPAPKASPGLRKLQGSVRRIVTTNSTVADSLMVDKAYEAAKKTSSEDGEFSAREAVRAFAASIAEDTGIGVNDLMLVGGSQVTARVRTGGLGTAGGPSVGAAAGQLKGLLGAGLGGIAGRVGMGGRGPGGATEGAPPSSPPIARTADRLTTHTVPSDAEMDVI